MMKLWFLPLLLFALAACKGNDGRGVDVEPEGLGALLTDGVAADCLSWEDTPLSSHMGFICERQAGYRFTAEVPRDGIVRGAVIMIPGATPMKRTRGIISGVVPAERFDGLLLISPEPRTYSVLGGLVTSPLWNGSGERSPRDNGCCVDSGMADRTFVAGLVRELRNALPLVPTFLVGFSNGGMLVFDLMYNELLDIDHYVMALSSDQTNGRVVSQIGASVSLIAVRDDEIIPFTGGPVALSFAVSSINAQNPFVNAPPFTETLGDLLRIKDCESEAETQLSSLGQGTVAKYSCDRNTVTAFVLEQGGHRLGSSSWHEPTPQRRDVIEYVLDRMEDRVAR